ncbi:hypothetical protein FPV67DRAFT_1456576 [Lyophyllum atratum]|nr:hypothetical protein FPV67DRAFT_1456576 [Lyophyllum atratum]
MGSLLEAAAASRVRLPPPLAHQTGWHWGRMPWTLRDTSLSLLSLQLLAAVCGTLRILGCGCGIQCGGCSLGSARTLRIPGSIPSFAAPRGTLRLLGCRCSIQCGAGRWDPHAPSAFRDAASNAGLVVGIRMHPPHPAVNPIACGALRDPLHSGMRMLDPTLRESLIVTLNQSHRLRRVAGPSAFWDVDAASNAGAARWDPHAPSASRGSVGQSHRLRRVAGPSAFWGLDAANAGLVVGIRMRPPHSGVRMPSSPLDPTLP